MRIETTRQSTKIRGFSENVAIISDAIGASEGIIEQAASFAPAGERMKTMAVTIGFLIRLEFYNANIDSALDAERDRLFGADNADYYSTYYVKQAKLTEEQKAFLNRWEEAGHEYWTTPVHEGDAVEWKSMQRGTAWSYTTASTPITHMVAIGPHHEMNEVFTLDEFATLDRDEIPANRQWLRITTATEADFAAWLAARRKFEVYDHRPYENDLNPVGEQEARDEYARRCNEAEATMRALEITEDATSATSG